MSALPFPLPPIVEEPYVILSIVDRLAVDDVLHLPAREKTYLAGGRPDRIVFKVRMRDGFSPEHWPSACGQVEKGSVYVQAGVLEHKPVCVDCLAALREGDPPAPDRAGEPAVVVAAAPTGEQSSPSLSVVKDEEEDMVDG